MPRKLLTLSLALVVGLPILALAISSVVFMTGWH